MTSSNPVCKCNYPSFNHNEFHVVYICERCNDPLDGWHTIGENGSMHYKEGFITRFSDWLFEEEWVTLDFPLFSWKSPIYYCIPKKLMNRIRKMQLKYRSRFQRKQMNKRLIQHRVIPRHFHAPFLLAYLVQFVV